MKLLHMSGEVLGMIMHYKHALTLLIMHFAFSPACRWIDCTELGLDAWFLWMEVEVSVNG
jgi:hypothetical protein